MLAIFLIIGIAWVLGVLAGTTASAIFIAAVAVGVVLVMASR